MATLDLRGSGSTLRLSHNSGSTVVRSFLVVGPKGDKGDPGPPGSGTGGSITATDNGDGTATITSTSGAVTDNNDGTATIAA